MQNKEKTSTKLSINSIKEAYNIISKFYKFFEENFEKESRKRGLYFLNPKEGEEILEIGFGTGCALVELAKSMKENGKVYGIDISEEMANLAKKRIEKERISKKVKLIVGDARKLPFKDNIFDGIYISETLELFDEKDILKVLNESRKVLKKNGRLIVISMNKEGHENSKFIKIYEWLHEKFPKYLNCRPIYSKEFLNESGFQVIKEKEIKISGFFPIKIIFSSIK